MEPVEVSAKKELLKSLMKCPHRKLEETVAAIQHSNLNSEEDD